MTLEAQPDVVTIGETMVALVPELVGPLRYNPSFRPRIAGAESNLAIGLAKLGHRASWISRVGDDEFGHYVNNAIRGEGVDTSGVVFDPDHRTGIMFKEMGVGETRVYYYRENSAASHLTPGDVNEALVRSTRIVHLTGITPVLSTDCEAAVLKAAELADRHGRLLSFDPNIRRKLWNGRDYRSLLKQLTLRAGIVLIGLEEAAELLDTDKPEEIFDILLMGEGAARAVALKNGAEGAWVADAETRRHIEPVAVKSIEPIGAGDAFNAGFLAGYLEGADIETCGRMGAVCGAMATTVVGDIEGYLSRARLHALMNHDKEVYR